jgi:hypothetical protein
MNAVVEGGAFLQSPDDCIRAVLGAVVRDREPLTIVDSPPGAGKTQLVEQIVALSVVHAGDRVYCVTPGADQAADLARRLRAKYELPRIELLWSTARAVPSDLAGLIMVTSDPNALAGGPCVVVSTISKLAMHRNILGAHSYSLLVCDEAYQVPFKEFSTIADLADRVVLVGDPGQLAPTIRVDTTRYEGTRFKVHRPAPAELHRLHTGARVFRLPASRRLLADTVQIVQPSFYRSLPFGSTADPQARRLITEVGGVGTVVDVAIDRILGGQSIVCIVVPGAPPKFDEHDDTVASIMASLAERFLTRQAMWVGNRRLTKGDIGVIDEHVASGAAIRQLLRERGLGSIKVDTPEVWQGLEVPLTVVKHPLSVARDPGSFELDAGRFCVMLSRHLLGCVVVTRASIEDSLHDYVHDCGGSAWGADDRTWNGYQSHRRVWAEVTRLDRVIPAIE